MTISGTGVDVNGILDITNVLPGTYTVTASRNFDQPYLKEITFQYTVVDVVANITTSTSTTFCDGGSVNLTSSNGDSYKWFKNGFEISGASSNSYTAITSGSYTVEVTKNSCKNYPLQL